MTITKLSPLRHTWLVDIDGTMLEHNGHKRGIDRLLPGVETFWQKIPARDVIILLSARKQDEREATLRFIDAAGLRYDQAVFGLPAGERILINDAKPSGLVTALAVNVTRDAGLTDEVFDIDPQL
jgi:hypothetical protein